MRFYYMLNLQHVVLFILPTLSFIIGFGLFLGYATFWSPHSQMRKKAVSHSYPDGIDGRNAPFPLAMLLIVMGIVLWAFFYILVNGWVGVKI